MAIEIARNLLHSTGTQIFFVPFFVGNQLDQMLQDGLHHLPELTKRMIPHQLMADEDYDVLQRDLAAFREAVNHDGVNSESLTAFRDLAAANHCPWKKIEKSYIRYRIGTMEIPRAEGGGIAVYGIWVAYETNWGNSKSGYCVSNPAITAGHQARFANNPEQNPSTPYIANQGDFFHPVDEMHPQQICDSFEIKHDNGVPFFQDFVELTISWVNPQTEPCDADLIIDLGNTRTVGLLMYPPLEGNQVYASFNALRSYCRPLLLAPKEGEYVGNPTSLDNAIVDTWFLLCKPPYESPVFEEWIRGEVVQSRGWFRKEVVPVLEGINQRVSYAFTQIAPVVCGKEAKRMYTQEMANRFADLVLSYEQSSPKRYYWQNEQTGIQWSMLLREYDEDYNDVMKIIAANPSSLKGEICRFMPTNGEILSSDVRLENNEKAIPNPDAVFPRSSTLTWFLVNILEKAWLQLNRTSEAGILRPKRLRRILGTYPSGWTEPEIDMYRKRWQEAVDIFRRTHFPEGTNPIDLDISLDEAMAGQIPFVVSEVLLVNGRMNSWLKVAGRCPQENAVSQVRIMNVDIGGGTTDIAVIEHSKTNDCPVGMTGISGQLLTKECFTTAGDTIVKGIIEKILVPRIGLNRDILNQNLGPQAQTKRVRAVRGCLIPLANAILSKVMANAGGNIRINDYCSANNWAALQNFLGVGLDAAAEITFDIQEVNQIIEDLFRDLINRCAFFAYAYDVDYVFLSGKPSELPKIKEIMEECFGLPSNRIIAAREYTVGDWYPFGNGQTIGDAKSVTAVGCAIKHALNEQRINGWCIESLPPIPMKNAWCVIPAVEGAVEPADDGELLDHNADEMQRSILLAIGTHIARRQNDLFRYEPVYKLESKDPTIPDRSILSIRFKRVKSVGGDALEITQATFGDRDVTNCVHLTIWPCATETYQFWQDSGMLDV